MILSWIVLLAEGLVCRLLRLFFEPDQMLAFVVIEINAFVAMIDIASRKDSKWVRRLLAAAFAFRLFLLLWDVFGRGIFLLPNAGLDTETYRLSAAQGFLTGEYGRGGMYSQFIGTFIYSLFGTQSYIAQYVNLLMGMSTILIVKQILRKQDVAKTVSERVVFVMAFLPNLAINNALLLRETIIIFLLALSLYFFFNWLRAGGAHNFLIGTTLSLVASIFHSGAIAAALAYALCFVFYDQNCKKFRFSAKTIFLAILVLIAFQMLSTYFGDVILAKFGNADSAEDIIAVANSRNDGGSAYTVGVSTGNSLRDVIVNTPIRMFYFVLSPLPWQWRGLNDMIAFFFSALVYGYCYVIAIRELKKGRSENRNGVIVCLLAAIASAVVFAWGVSNAGTALRHRDKFVAIYMVLMGLCWNGRYTRTVGLWDEQGT